MMRRLASLFVILAVVFVARSAAAHNDDPLFEVAGPDGAVRLAVTETVIARLRPVSYQAILPGTDRQPKAVTGPLLRDVLREAGLEGYSVVARGLDRYEMKIPAADYLTFDMVVAVAIDGERLTVRRRGPAWLVYPSVDHPKLQGELYQSRSVWQLIRIDAE